MMSLFLILLAMALYVVFAAIGFLYVRLVKGRRKRNALHAPRAYGRS
jgi:hypothetical protein